MGRQLVALIASVTLTLSVSNMVAAQEPNADWTVGGTLHDKVQLHLGEVDGRKALIAVTNHTQISVVGELGEQVLTIANLDGGYSQVLTWDTSSSIRLECSPLAMITCLRPGHALMLGDNQIDLTADGGMGGSVMLHAGPGLESGAYDVTALALGFVLPGGAEAYFAQAAIALAPDALNIASLIWDGRFVAASDAFVAFLVHTATYFASTWPELVNEGADNALSWLLGKAGDLVGVAVMPIKGGINAIKTATVFSNLGAAWLSGAAEDEVQVDYKPSVAGDASLPIAEASPSPTTSSEPSITGDGVPGWCRDVLRAGVRLVPGASDVTGQFEESSELFSWTCFGSFSSRDSFYRIRSYEWAFKGSAASFFGGFVAHACDGDSSCHVLNDLGAVRGIGDRAHQLRLSLGDGAVSLDWIVILDGKRVVGFGCRDCVDGPALTEKFARTAFPLLRP